MKKITALTLVFSVIFNGVLLYRPVQAADHVITVHSKGTNCSDNVSFDPAAVTINSGEVVSFVLPKDDPSAEGIAINNFPGGSFTIFPGGQSHSTPSLVIDVPSYYATKPSKNNCQVGTGSVKVISSTSPAPSPPPPAPVVAPISTPKLTASKPPDPLKLDTVAVNGEKVDILKPLKVSQSQSLTISGYTVANGAVNLTIHSAVHKEMARANDSGFWTFTIQDLEVGNHTVEASVTDLSTHLTSQNATLLKFAVTAESSTNLNTAVNANAGYAPKSNDSGKIIIGVIAFALLIGVDGYVYWFLEIQKKPKKLKITQAPPPAEIAPSA